MLCVVSNKNAAVSGYQSAADNANGTAPRSKNIFVGYLILEMPSDSQSEKGKNYISDMLHCVKLDSVVMPCTAVSFHVLTFNQLELRRLQRLQSDKTWPALSLEQLLFSFGGSGKWRRNSLLSIYGARPMNMECIFMLIAVFPAKWKTSVSVSEVGRELHKHMSWSCKVSLSRGGQEETWGGIFCRGVAWVWKWAAKLFAPSSSCSIFSSYSSTCSIHPVDEVVDG